MRASVADLNPRRHVLTPGSQLGDNCDCSALDRLGNKSVRVGLLAANSDKDRSRCAGARIVRDISASMSSRPVTAIAFISLAKTASFIVLTA